MAGTIGIIGAGAVGRGLAHSLLKSQDISVALIQRSGKQLAHFQVEEGGQIFAHELPPRKTRNFDKIFYCVKSYDLKEALETWLTSAGDHGSHILLGNGYLEPIVQPFRKEFPKAGFVKGVVTRGARFDEKALLHLSPGGGIVWGDQTSSPSALEEKLFASAAELRWEPNACAMRKDKWFCNTVLNTLSGAYRLPNNGSALKIQEFDSLADEVYILGTMLWPEWKSESEKPRLKTLLRSIIAATLENENSMAVDVRLGRRTEAPVLSGIAKTLADSAQKFPILNRLENLLALQKI